MSYFRTTLLAFISIIFLAAPFAHAQNAKMFKLTANGDLSKVKGYNWSNRWAQIVPFSARGENLLLFYDRDRGLGKLFSYNGAGQMFGKKTFTGWSKDWDHVIAGQFGEANMIFYNRVNGRLKAFRISETGSMSLQFQQTIENPVGASLISVADPPDGPGGPGWDIVTPGRWSWVNGRTVPGLLFYNRTEGRALFLRYDEAEGIFVFAHRYQGWNNSWDEIKAADFNGDQVDDLVLYDQDGGKLKVIYMNEDYSFRSHLFLKDRDEVFAGRTHFPQLVIGNFGGGRLKKDILLYQQDKCPDGQDCVMDDHGRGLLWTDNRRSGWNLNPKVYSNWSDDWTHVIPVETNPTYYGSTGLLFYRNQVTLKLVIWEVLETEKVGTVLSNTPLIMERPSQPLTDWSSTWNAGKLAQVDKWIEAAQNTYKTAGIKFEATVKHGAKAIFDNEIVDWTADVDFRQEEDGARVYGCSDIANLVKGWVWFTDQPVDTIHAFVIPGTGTGCSWHDRNHLLVGAGSLSNPKHLGHELGHYLGLPHTNVSEALDSGYIKPKCKIPPQGAGSYTACVGAIADKLVERKNTLGRDVRFADLDRDHHKKNGSWIYDTPPVLNKVVTQHLYETTESIHESTNRSSKPGNCKPGARYTFTYQMSGPVASRSKIEMYQESHNVMSYTNCNGLFRISKDQARVIRQGLFRTGPFGTHKDGTAHSYGWRSGLIGN